MSDMPIGKYHVLATLGQGAHSTILHIRRAADAKQYALKVVPIANKEELKFLEQAQFEYKVARLFDHPNLLKVYALETESDWLFRVRKAHLLLEYINGTTLDKAPALRLPLLVQVFVRAAAGLVHMHKKGVLHADLKPNNLMLSRGGDVKIIDYGLAWIKGQAKNRIQGTPEYMAPETARSKQVNERTDIYNLGATMYRLLTGELPPVTFNPSGALPLDGGTFLRLLKPVLELKPKTPRVLAEVIERCLSFEPTKRPERASEVQGLLDRLADELVRSPADRLEALEW